MDSFIPMGGVQLPAFQRRLSRLYNDTKRSSDFVKEPPHHAEADPEIKVLHRKLRIQKDRLVTWGLEWSDPNQSAEVLIDSSLSKAGLSEVVGSIMSTIKDILAEAEPLWHSSRRLAGERVEPENPPKKGEKIQMVVWDKNRFEDLVRDLTTSIDTLYDLSRTRSSYAQAPAALRERLSRPTAAPEDFRPFESSRIQTPQQIDPKSLTNLRSMQAEPMTELAEKERSREIVFMSKQAYAELTQGAGGRQPHAPLLLEYASFDSIYSMTGISPPMARFEKLSAGLQSEPQRSPGSWTGLPRLLGYFEDMENSRFGLVYQFPRTFNPVTFEHLTQNPLYNLCSLADLLARPDFEPKLEAKFRLAANLANTVFDMHARGITHGNLVGENVSFCNAVGTDPEVSGITQGEVDIRRPLISSFDLFSDPQSQDIPRPYSLYRHPLDPRNSAESPLANNADSKTFDLYSLAMVLLSVGLWTKLENLVPNMESPTLPQTVLEQLAIRCGTLYMKAVQTCWNAVDQEMSGFHTTEQIVSRVQFRASRYLEACCILDGVSNLEERLGDDLGEPRPEPARLSTSSLAGPSKDAKSEKPRIGTPAEGKPEQPSSLVSPVARQPEAQAETQAPTTTEDATQKPPAKMRLYPHIPLPPEVIEQWNTVFMPQINSALRPFYRKNPESVEISLESIGESPQRTRPTVLVVCTSVSKVRAILKKKLGSLFDGTGGVGLKVCRGQVLRSRKDPTRRSKAKSRDDGHGDLVAANPDYQERPHNGASIGAWIRDRHLPPVSLGGLIMVDDKQYGMTVHHMLDDPDQDQQSRDAAGKEGAPRSMAGPQSMPDLAAWYAEQYQNSESDPDSSGTEDYACEFSDSDSDTYSESAITSEYSDEEEEEEDQYAEPGDIPGVEPGCGEGYIVTQPALDDVPEGFYPSSETEDEDHLDTYSLGEIYASSGLRRRMENGLLHEIDWALFEFSEERLPGGNLIPHLDYAPAANEQWPSTSGATIHPTSVVPSSSLPGLQVQCMARTSGLQSGLILPAVASVKIYGRTSPSQIYQVSGTRPQGHNIGTESHRSLPMGIPGDSGAWVVDRDQGQVCGHILAWSERKRVAYICPMDVLLLDIAETLEANEIRLPGGKVIFSRYSHKLGRTLTQSSKYSAQVPEPGEGDEEDEEVPNPVSTFNKRRPSRRSQLSHMGSDHQSRQAGDAGGSGDDADDDSCDEAVDVELVKDIKELHMSEQGVPMEIRRWGIV
ncbi:HET-s/LopB domain protein [Madurella fahalii]|uniref:HET-s/LopB domain protein n=1 Tax=Madurella fahalii TaxID=1157608 RepID=A0ABQ0GQ44_9PEZI